MLYFCYIKDIQKEIVEEIFLEILIKLILVVFKGKRMIVFNIFKSCSKINVKKIGNYNFM